jgi:hypothetical protein
VDLGGCLDSTVTGPYGRSRAAREEKTVRRRDRGPAWPPAQRRKEIRKTKRPTDLVLVKHKDEANSVGYLAYSVARARVIHHASKTQD